PPGVCFGDALRLLSLRRLEVHDLFRVEDVLDGHPLAEVFQRVERRFMHHRTHEPKIDCGCRALDLRIGQPVAFFARPPFGTWPVKKSPSITSSAKRQTGM